MAVGHRVVDLLLHMRLAVLGVFVLACGDVSGGPQPLDLSALQDPAACQSCHPDHFREWSGSMHAYAAQDPVFLAMNARGQRETHGALGTFCVNCHAPVAVREGLTTDGLNLASLPAAKKGVTCYFCHSAAAINGTHDNPLVLTNDGSLFGPFANPAPGAPHRSSRSPHFDDTSPASAAMCGACHDIVTPAGAPLERTFSEWQGTLFSVPPNGLSCQACHMAGRDGPASTVSSVSRRLHSHTFAGLDLAIDQAFPERAAQEAHVQELLDTTLQSSLCLDTASRTFQVVLENVGAGHGFPSGSSADRRAWVEVAARVGDTTIFSTGQQRGTELVAGNDPDLWLMRDCLFDGAGAEKHMFWEAAAISTSELPGSVVMTLSDPSSFSRTHLARTFPAAGPLPALPDAIELKVHVQPVGDDVIADLVASGDLAAGAVPSTRRFEIAGAALTWTKAEATRIFDATSGSERLCVTTGKVPPQFAAGRTLARCVAP